MFSIRCLECKRQIAYITRKTGEGICQVCGYVMTKEEVDKQREEQKKKTLDK